MRPCCGRGKKSLCAGEAVRSGDVWGRYGVEITGFYDRSGQEDAKRPDNPRFHSAENTVLFDGTGIAGRIILWCKCIEHRARGALMADLSTTYMGLSLKNPLVAASSGLTGDINVIRRLAENGAGAVVLKSIFEEQVKMEIASGLEQHIGSSWHSEAYDYVHKMGMEFGPSENLRLIEGAKKAVSIPVIASLNCVSANWWKDYAKQIASAGADGIELNIAYSAADVKKDGKDVEQLYYRILDKVKGSVKLPVAVKLGPYFTSFSNFAYELCRRGADALVLFNRFYQFDIDIEKRKIVAGNPMSSMSEMSLPLRWIALLAHRVNCDLSATTGVHTGAQVIKQVLAGARVVQVCSVLYKNGTEYMGTLLGEVADWMDAHKIESLDEMRGNLSREESGNPELYERLQYIRALVGIE